MTDAALLPALCAADAPGARRLAGGWASFDRVRRREVDGFGAPEPLDDARDAAALQRLTAPRPALLGLALDRPRLMAVVNITPDSFSDGGRHFEPKAAVESALAMVEAGADLLDIGGESTRPGAETVPEAEELRRVLPVIEGLVAAGCSAPISIDTRKARVAREAFAAGARLFNDVSALSFDRASAETAAELMHDFGGWLCLMHAQGEPKTMQQAPRYEHVALDVYDALKERLSLAAAAGAPMQRILLDPGIGFGKTGAHNLELLRVLALFHGLGAPLLLGVSRKRFIGSIAREPEPARRGPGSIAAALWGVAQGAQVIRAHDVVETAQALAVWRALGDEAAGLAMLD